MNVVRRLKASIFITFFLFVSIANGAATSVNSTAAKGNLSTLDQQALEGSLNKINGLNQSLNGKKLSCRVNPNCMSVVQKWIDDDLNATSYKSEGITNKFGMWVLGSVPKERADSCKKALQDNGTTSAYEMAEFYEQNFFKDKFKPGLMDESKTCNTGTENKNKLITSKAYYGMARLEQAASALVDELAGIDESVPGSSTLSNVVCADDFPQVAKKCDHYKKDCVNKTASDPSQWKAYVTKAEETYKQIQSLDEKIKKIERPGHRGRGAGYLPIQNQYTITRPDEQGNVISETVDRKAYLSYLKQVRALLAATNPQVDQKIFKDKIADKIKFEDALKDQLASNRKELSATMVEVNKALRCLKTNSSDANCSPTEIGKLMNKLPEVPDPFSLSKKENYKDPRWKSALSGIETHRCLTEATQDRNNTADVMRDTGINMGLTFLTLGAGAGVIAAKAGLTASRVAIISRAGFAVSGGADAAWFANSMKTAYSICSDHHTTELNQVFQGAQVPEKRCPGLASNLSMATKKIDSCAQAIIMAGLDGLPLTSAALMANAARKIPPAPSAEKGNITKPLETTVSRTEKRSLATMTEIAKKENKPVDEIRRENFGLSDEARIAKIKQDFPNLSDSQVESIVNQVHGEIGRERRLELYKKAKSEGRALTDEELKYTAEEITAKAKALSKLGIAASDREALIRLGYAGENASLLEEILSRTSQVASKVDETAHAKSTAVRTKSSIRQDIKKAEAEYQRLAQDVNASPIDRVTAKEKVAELQQEMIQQEMKLNPNLLNDVLANTSRTPPSSNLTAATEATTESTRASQSDRIPISQSKFDQLTKGDQHSAFDVLMIENKPGSTVLFKSNGNYQRGVISGVDPENADNLILTLTDANGKVRKTSVAQTDIAMTTKEEAKVTQAAIDKVTAEARARGKSVLDETIEATNNSSASLERYIDEKIKAIGRNPHAEEIAQMKARYQAKSAEDPTYFTTEEGQNLLVDIHKLEYKVAPFDSSEVRMFHALDEVSTGTLRLGSGEKKLIAELEAKIAAKSNISASDAKLIAKLEEIKKRPDANLESRLSAASSRLRRMNDTSNFANYRVPNEVRSAASKMLDTRDDKAALDLMEGLFKRPPYEITELEIRSKLALDSFFNKFAGKKGEKLEEVRKNNPALAHYLDRLSIYREVDDLKNGHFQNITSNPIASTSRLNNPAREAEAQRVLSTVSSGSLKEKAQKLKEAGFNERERRLLLDLNSP